MLSKQYQGFKGFRPYITTLSARCHERRGDLKTAYDLYLKAYHEATKLTKEAKEAKEKLHGLCAYALFRSARVKLQMLHASRQAAGISAVPSPTSSLSFPPQSLPDTAAAPAPEGEIAAGDSVPCSPSGTPGAAGVPAPLEPDGPLSDLPDESGPGPGPVPGANAAVVPEARAPAQSPIKWLKGPGADFKAWSLHASSKFPYYDGVAARVCRAGSVCSGDWMV